MDKDRCRDVNMIKFISEEEKVEFTMHGRSDEILAELENACCIILDKVSQIEGCNPEQLTQYFTQNLCEKSKSNFVHGTEDGLS